MDGQMSFEDWMPVACPGTKEFEAAKAAKEVASVEVEAAKPAKRGRKKTIAENTNAVVKEPTKEYVPENRENWYALLVAILRPDIKGADDAMAAMGIKRTYNSGEQSEEQDSYVC